MMKGNTSTDYATYREILNDLVKPIDSEGLDQDTLKRLYESKLVYLENLRIKCFREINVQKMQNMQQGLEAFTPEDFQLILRVIADTRSHLRMQVMRTIQGNLAKVRGV